MKSVKSPSVVVSWDRLRYVCRPLDMSTFRMSVFRVLLHSFQYQAVWSLEPDILRSVPESSTSPRSALNNI
jgi:hypothetical protein